MHADWHSEPVEDLERHLLCSDRLQINSYDDWDNFKTYTHLAVALFWACDTPFHFIKQIASHFGGARHGPVISWPNSIKHAGGIRNQFHHFIDMVSTILDLVGVK